MPEDRTIVLPDKTAHRWEVEGTAPHTPKPWQPFSPLPAGPDPSSVPGCTLEGILGSGGMGTVYLARQDTLDRKVAVKVLNSRLANDPDFIARLRQEALIMGAMSHHNLVGCHDIIVTKNGACIVMEYIPGHLNGRNAVEQLGPIPERYVVKILLEVTRGLAYAYAKGFTHRDVKPDNILFSFGEDRLPRNYEELFHHPDSRIAICDFGIASAKANLPAAEPQDDHPSETVKVMGSPVYMAPEQAVMPDKVDCRTDMYSLAATAYFLLTGKPPFTGKDWNAILDAKVEHDLPAPRLASGKLSGEFSHILARMGALLQDDRYPDYQSLLKDLEALAMRYADQMPSLRSFLYAHQRGIWYTLIALVPILAISIVALHWYNAWLEDFEKRLISQTANLALWDGAFHQWRQSYDPQNGRSILRATRGAGGLAMRDRLRPGDYFRIILKCRGQDAFTLRLSTAFTPAGSEQTQTIGVLGVRRSADKRYHVNMISTDYDHSTAPTGNIPIPDDFPDAGEEWLNLKVEFTQNAFLVWNRSRLLGVSHFTLPADAEKQDITLNIAPIRCDEVTIASIIIVHHP